jgi:hypothetical protein
VERSQQCDLRIPRQGGCRAARGRLEVPGDPIERARGAPRPQGADGAVDSKVVGPKGGVTTVDRSKNADGTTNAVTTNPQGQVSTATRAKDAGGAVDAVRTGPNGTTIVDRTQNADGTVDKTVTTTRP